MRAAAAFAIVAVIAIALSSCMAQSPDEKVGQPMPKFSMKDTTGAVLTNESLRGRVVLIDFWATWCGPCKKISPVIDKLNKKFGNQGAVFIGADALETKPGPHAAAYKKAHGYSYIFTESNEKLVESLGLDGVPAIFIMDRKGVIRSVMLGFGNTSEAELTETLTNLLKA